MMEAARTYKTSVNFYQTSRRINPEDSHLLIRRCEKLKSHLVTLYTKTFYQQLGLNCIKLFSNVIKDGVELSDYGRFKVLF
jgi:hypothetical protein